MDIGPNASVLEPFFGEPVVIASLLVEDHYGQPIRSPWNGGTQWT